MSPDPKKFSRLFFYVSSGFIGLYLVHSLQRLYKLRSSAHPLPPDVISPVVDLVIIGMVVLAYGVFLLVRHLRGREERAFLRHYSHRTGKNPSSAADERDADSEEA